MKVLTKSEQRLKWLESLRRPLTRDEQDELYRCLHAIYVRERRIAKLEGEARDKALAAHRAETEEILERVQREAFRKVNAPPNDEWMDDAREGSAKLLDAIQRLAA